MDGSELVQLRLGGSFPLWIRCQRGLLREDVNVIPIGISLQREVARHGGKRVSASVVRAVVRPLHDILLTRVVEPAADARHDGHTLAPTEGALQWRKARVIVWHSRTI